MVLDHGSCFCKTGLLSQDEPHIFPTFVERLGNSNSCEWAVGEAVFRHTNRIRRVWKPISEGDICDWEKIEKIWDYAMFGDHLMNSKDKRISVCLSETMKFSSNPKNREKMAEIMFETFGVNSLYTANQQVFSLYSLGRTSGIVVDLGAETSYVVPVLDGCILKDNIVQFGVHGKYLNDKFHQRVSERGWSFTTSEERNILCAIKEEKMFISMDIKAEANSIRYQELNKNYEFYDGTSILLQEELFEVPESIFTEKGGLHYILKQVVSSLGEDNQQKIRNKFLLCGGSTMFPGFNERLKKELSECIANQNFEILLPSNKLTASWHGAARFANSPDFANLSLQNEDYNEIGPSMLHTMNSSIDNRRKSAKSQV